MECGRVVNGFLMLDFFSRQVLSHCQNSNYLIMSLGPLGMNSEETDPIQVQWLKNKVMKKKAISMREFAIAFEYLCEHDADEASRPFCQKVSSHKQHEQLY